MQRGFSGGKKVIKSANTRNRGQICLFKTTENTELFILKGDNGKLWVGLIVVIFFNVVATVNVFTESKTCRNSTVHFARLKFVVSFEENKQTRPQLVILTNSNTCPPLK